MKYKALFLLLASIPAAQSAVVLQADLATWQTAAGATTHFEDFSGFLTDTQFRTQTVALNGFSIHQTGNRDFRNLVDVSPYQYGDNNGTAHASTFVEADNNIQVVLSLLNPATAFSGFFFGAIGGEGLDVVVELTSGGSATFSPAWGTANTFFGVTTTDGDLISSIRLVARLADGDLSGGEGFALDDIRLVSEQQQSGVPEPSTFALLGAGAALLALRRRRNA